MLKIAIVGCGQIAEGHIEEIRKIDGTEVVAVCDIEELMAEQLAERYGVPKYYDDFQKLLSETNPAVIHITTPPQSHLSLSKIALAAGCHVYVEKPFTVTVEETDELLLLAEKAVKKLTVGHIYYFDPPAVAMRELISKGVLGEVVHVESFYGYNLAGSFGSAILGNINHWVHKLPGKLFQNNIDHLLNKITEFIPDDSPEIIARGYKQRYESFRDIRDDMFDELRVMINGKGITSYATFSSHVRPAGHFARIYGTKGIAHVDYVSRTITVDSGPKMPSAIGRLILPFATGFQFLREGRKNIISFAKSEFYFFAGMNKLIRLFYDSILKDKPLPISYRDIRRVTAFMHEIFRQASQGGNINENFSNGSFRFSGVAYCKQAVGARGKRYSMFDTTGKQGCRSC